MTDEQNKRLNKLETEHQHLVTVHLTAISKGQMELSKKLDLALKDLKHEIEKIHILDQRQNEMLDEHIQRSNNLETIIESLKSVEISPIKKHVHMVEGGMKLLGLIALLLGIAGGVFKLLF